MERDIDVRMIKDVTSEFSVRKISFDSVSPKVLRVGSSLSLELIEELS